METEETKNASLKRCVLSMVNVLWERVPEVGGSRPRGGGEQTSGWECELDGGAGPE